MSTQLTCPYCGQEIPDDALFCAQCGRSLTDFRARYWDRIYAAIDNMHPYAFGLLGFIAIVLISRLAFHTITTLGSPAALIALFIGMAGFSAALGWLWHQALPNPLRFRRFMLLCASAVFSMWVLSFIDSLIIKGLGTHTVGYRLPGILVQASSEHTKTSIWSDIMWWIMTACGLVVSLAVDGYQRTRPST